MRVSDWIADYLYQYGIRNVHGLMGGGASGLNDGFIKHGKIKYLCYHHEQGAGHAAIGESKYTGKLSVVNPTTGCGGTNCATSVLDAWQDGVPVLFLSGNVRLDTCSGYINSVKNIDLRKYGVQEHHVVDTMASMCKFTGFVESIKLVPYLLQKAIYHATNGRPGPVWLDIPSDIQTSKVEYKDKKFDFYDEECITPNNFELQEYILSDILNSAERPVILAGYGIRQSNTVDQFITFVERYNIPFVSTYGARDYLPHESKYSIGAVGVRGSRSGNFAMQNADVLLILGSSLGTSVIGYDPKQFSPNSIKIYVDIDGNELKKDVVKIDHKIQIDLQTFFKEMLQ